VWRPGGQKEWLNDPWQDLLDYYSAKEIATTRYAQILETVTPKDLSGSSRPSTVRESAAAPSQPSPHS
jgi:hypothetical protein